MHFTHLDSIHVGLYMHYLNEEICIIISNVKYQCEYVAISFLLNKRPEKKFFSDQRHVAVAELTRLQSRKRVTLYIRHIRYIRDIYRGSLSMLRNYIIDIYVTPPRIAVFQLIQTINFIVHIHELLKCNFFRTRTNSLLT